MPRSLVKWIELFYRLFGAGILCVFAYAPIFIVSGIVRKIIADPKGTPVEALIALIVCIPLTYVLLLIAWRAFTGRSSRKDGGLLPPLVLKVFAVVFAVGILAAAVQNTMAGNPLRALGGIGLLVAPLSLFRIAKRRSDAASVAARNSSPPGLPATGSETPGES